MEIIIYILITVIAFTCYLFYGKKKNNIPCNKCPFVQVQDNNQSLNDIDSKRKRLGSPRR